MFFINTTVQPETYDWHFNIWFIKSCNKENINEKIRHLYIIRFLYNSSKQDLKVKDPWQKWDKRCSFKFAYFLPFFFVEPRFIFVGQLVPSVSDFRWLCSSKSRSTITCAFVTCVQCSEGSSLIAWIGSQTRISKLIMIHQPSSAFKLYMT